MSFVLEFKNITKDYVTEGGITQKVLRNISFGVKKGEFLSIMGPSGSGKTTCMNIIGCLDYPTSGQYLLNGQDVSKLSADDLAIIRNETLGFVFQNFNLLGKRNLIDNVALPLVYLGVKEKIRVEIAKEYLSKVKLKGYENYLPGQLSGGMKQRVAIARALIGEPKIILADEPTGNLDTKTGYEILELFAELNEKLGITIVMITHEPDIAAKSKRCIHIKDGIIEKDEILKKGDK